jgi:hypothetical protein
MKTLFFITTWLLFSSLIHAGPLADKFYEFTDSAIEKTHQIQKYTTNVIRDTKEKVSNSYQNYKHRKALKVEKRRKEKQRVNNAVNYYEQQMRKKNSPKTTVKYKDPCFSSHAHCKIDSLNQKWCWFPGASKALCSSPTQQQFSKKIETTSSKILLQKSLKKKRNNCRKKVYEDWARDGAKNHNFSSAALTAELKAKCN